MRYTKHNAGYLAYNSEQDRDVPSLIEVLEAHPGRFIQ